MLKVMLHKLKQSFTLVIIPETGNSVRSFRAPLLAAGAVVLFFVLLLATLIWLLILQHNQRTAVQMLQNQLIAQEAFYSAETRAKDNLLAQLEAELLTFAEQGRLMREDLRALQQLEQEVDALLQLNLLQEAEVSKTSGRVQILALSPLDDQVEPYAAGGEDYPLELLQTEQLLSDTKALYSSLEQVKKQLHSRLTQTQEDARLAEEILRASPAMWPAASRRITSTFGIRRDPFTRRPSMHRGLDIAGPVGDPIYAAGDGTVVESAYNSNRGHYIILEHGPELQSVYMHLRKRHVAEGDKVQQGDEIGTMGSTGRSTGSHLHFEVIREGVHVDPADYLTFYKEE